MFSTTILRTEPVTTEHEFALAIGDRVAYASSRVGDKYQTVYEIVSREALKGGVSSYDLAQVLSDGTVNASDPYRGETNWDENIADGYAVLVRRAGLVEPVTFDTQVAHTFEHEFTVDDVIRATENGIYDWRITEVGANTSKWGVKRVGYHLIATDDGYDAGFYQFDQIDGKYVLVGGPRFEAERAARRLTALKALQQARALITDPDAWIKNDYSRAGVQFCAVGAINHVTLGAYAWGTEEEQALHAVRTEARDALAQIIKPDYVAEGNGSEGTITTWNDKAFRTHEQVLAAFDKAIGDLQWAAVQS